MNDDTRAAQHRYGRAIWVPLLLIGIFLFALLNIFFSKKDKAKRDQALTAQKQLSEFPTNETVPSRLRDWRSRWPGAQKVAPEEIVRSKLTQFGRSRRKLAEILARKNKIKMPPEVERFFAAVERGNWDEIEATFTAISGEDSSATSGAPKRTPEVNKLWPAILDAFGAAEQAHLLPAKALLNYGYEILDSLRPDMIYVGGTDPGRWVPALVNEDEPQNHIVITQNGLCDSTYLGYVRLQFGDQLSIPDEAGEKRAFEDYITDARARLEHDEKFPNEPKQLRPGEDVKIVDGKVQVSGQIAVMSINEKLLQQIIDLNPGASFGLQESFPLKNTYANAAPLGPIMELRAQKTDAETSFSSDAANESLNRWREISQQILRDSEYSGSLETLKTYSHDAVAAANLLAAHDFTDEAEEAYQLSRQMWPGNPEAPVALADLLTRSGRAEEGAQIIQEFLEKYPGERRAVDRLSGAVDYYRKQD